MRPGTLGRALGIGVRLTKQRILPTPARTPTSEQREAASRKHVRTGEALGRKVRGAHQGGKHFSRAVWNPFAHASSILWLEITGAFFALFAFLFAQHAWSLRAAWRTGPEHAHLLVYVIFAVIFAYFAATSFARARKRNRRRQREQR